MYLKTFKHYTLLKVRMKISYEAMCKQATIKEHFIMSIVHVYNLAQKKSEVVPSQVEKENTKALLNGDMNLKVFLQN